MADEVKAGTPRWILIGTGIAGLVAAIFFAATKFYELHKARNEAVISDPQRKTDENEKTQPEQEKDVVWVGISDNTFPVRFEAKLQSDGSFSGDYFVLNRAGSIRAHFTAEGKITGRVFDFRTIKIVRTDGQIHPVTMSGTYTDKRIEGTWRTLNGINSGPFYLEPEKKNSSKK